MRALMRGRDTKFVSIWAFYIVVEHTQKCQSTI